MSGSPLSRRTLLAGGAFTAVSYSRILGANNRATVGAIGVGDRGRHVMGLFQRTERVEVAAVCDVYAQQIDLALQQAPGAKSYSDTASCWNSVESTRC